MFRSFFTLILCFIFGSVFSQDVIVKKDQTKIFCEIVSVDSLFITYKKSPSKNNFQIPREDVANYSFAQPVNERTPQTAPVEVKTRESVHIGFRAGMANPIGEFANADVNSETAGLAMSGLLLEGSLLLRASEYFGILLNYRDQRNPFNAQPMISALDPTGRFNIEYSVEDWRSRGLFAGLSILLPFKNIRKLSFNSELLAGFPLHYYPSVTLKYPSFGGAWDKGSAPPVRSFSFDLGIGILYKVHKNVAFFGGCDYLYAKPTFAQTFTSSSGRVSFSTHEQKISTINFKLGVSYIFLQKVQP